MIVECAIRIHRTVEPGILEKAYFGCVCYELVSAGLKIQTQKDIPLIYHGVHIDCAYRADLIFSGVASSTGGLRSRPPAAFGGRSRTLCGPCEPRVSN